MLEGKMAKSKQTLVVACEAGAGNILSSWLKQQPEKNTFSLCIEGPSTKIFSLAHPTLNRVSLDSFERESGQFNQLIVGSSWMPNLEREALEIARKLKIPSVGIVDHWVNYKERFLPTHLWQSPPADWKTYLPDTVWVFDSYAKKIALATGYPAERLVLKDNPYLEEIRKSILSAAPQGPRSPEIRLLYICEPIAEDVKKTYGDSLYWGFDEFQLMDRLLEDVKNQARAHGPVRARIRLHPNEAKNKYDSWIEGSANMELSHNDNLATDIAWADLVIGVESMAMVAALYSGKPVFSVLPSKAKKPYYLPFTEILRCERPAIAIEQFKKMKEQLE